MLKVLKDLFETLVQPASASPRERDEALKLATAVLLVEVMRADANTGPSERETILLGLRENFGLVGSALDDLLAQAEQQAKTAHDYHYFTSLLNDHLSHPQKIQVVENMWRVAYADASLDANENHLISKIAGLLHVTHGEYIAAKIHAKLAAPGHADNASALGADYPALRPLPL